MTINNTSNIEIDIYPFLDKNEVVITLHSIMKLLVIQSQYKTIITNIEKYYRQNKYVYTLVILKSCHYLKPNDIIAVFKKMHVGVNYGYTEKK